MRTLIQKSVSVLTVFIISLCVMSVMAQAGKLLVDENFEEYDAGSGPADWGEKWHIDTDDRMSASDEVVHSGQRSLKLDKTEACRISRIFEATEENVITVEFYVYPNIDTERAMTCNIFGGDPLNPDFAIPGDWGPFISCLNVGDFAYHDGEQWHSVAAYKANQWYHIKLIADVDTNTFDFYVDDMDTPVKKGADFYGDQENLSSFYWFKCDAYFDDMLVYEGTQSPKAVIEAKQKLSITWGRIKRGSINSSY